MEYLDKEYPNHKYLKSPGILNSMVQILVAEKKEQDEYILQLEKKNAKLTKKASKAEQKLDVHWELKLEESFTKTEAELESQHHSQMSITLPSCSGKRKTNSLNIFCTD